MAAISRRAFIGSTAVAAAAACAPGTAPEAPRTSGGGSDADQQWNALVAAAKQEGTLVLQTGIGERFRKAVEEFEKAFPGITVDHTTLALANFRPRILQERAGRIYAFDVLCSTFGPIGVELAASGVPEPFRSAVIRPEFMEDKVWRDTFEAGFPDTEKKWAYGTTRSAERRLWINTEIVKEGEIKEVKDLMDPKWKGKIIGTDLRNMGSASYPASLVRRFFGDEGIKRIWKDNEVVLSRDARISTEAMVRGQYAVGIGAVDEGILKSDFLPVGVGKQLKPVLLDNFDTITYSDVLMFVNRAPHPNAAKLFINWMLSKEGQTAWTKQTETNSRRVDVEPVNPDWEPDPKRKYGVFQGPDLDYDLDTRKIATDILK
jgi:iron(III) transport system substrate-binding protein